MRKGFTLIELMIVIAIIAIIAAIAIPNLMESRVTANEAAASASLKSGVFPASVQFQGGGYQDADADNVGEYGTIGAMAGVAPTIKIGTGQIKLVTGPLATGAATLALRLANGYQYTSFVPAATDTAQATTSVWLEGDAAFPAQNLVTSNNNGERYFVYACAPERFSDTGRRVFALTSDGQLRSPATAADLNLWFGGAPISGQVPVIGGIRNGMADVYAAAGADGAYVITMLDGATPVYPTYSR